jgi:hypothetical protein
MTSGEKMIWAAAFVHALYKGDSEMGLVGCAYRAYYDVELSRAALTDMEALPSYEASVHEALKEMLND